MNKTRPSLARIGKTLNGSGIALLVPDLYGTGDSEGEFRDATWSKWRIDLKAISNWARVNAFDIRGLIAVRSGLLLAMDWISEHGDNMRSSVWLQPVESGERFLSQLLRLRTIGSSVSRGVSESVDQLRGRLYEGETINVGGYELSPEMATGMASRLLSEMPTACFGNVLTVNVVRVAANTSFKGHASATATERISILGEPYWNSTEIVVNDRVVNAASTHLVNAVADHRSVGNVSSLDVGANDDSHRSSVPERAFTLSCGRHESIGILSEGSIDVGFVIVVGGPQYRVGSHRMFVRVARALAQAGFPALRFDTRGMGDSPAEFPTFEGIGPDIANAIDEFVQRSGCEKVVLLGLCDGASAVAMYASTDPRIKGVCLVNPWVRSTTSEARAMLDRYYGKRLLQSEFWRSIAAGKVNLLRSVADLIRTLSRSRTKDASVGFVEQMRDGLAAFDGAIHVCLSADDIVSAEFRELGKTPAWSDILQRAATEVDDFPTDHTFSGDGQLGVLIESIVRRFRGLVDK